jgi:hypothetical protein
MASERPRVKVRFKFNEVSGEIEELIIDDAAPDRSEKYHDDTARAIAERLGPKAEIRDAGPRAALYESVLRVPEPNGRRVEAPLPEPVPQAGPTPIARPRRDKK